MPVVDNGHSNIGNLIYGLYEVAYFLLYHESCHRYLIRYLIKGKKQAELLHVPMAARTLIGKVGKHVCSRL